MSHNIESPKHIIIVTTLFDHGGIATYWQSIAREMDGKYKFIVFSNLVKDLDPDPFKLKNVIVIPELIWKAPLKSCKILIDLVIKYNPESVFFNGTLAKFKLLPAIILLRILFSKINICTVFHSGALYQSKFKNNINLWLVKFSTLFISRRIFVSKAVEMYWSMRGETITRPFVAKVKDRLHSKSRGEEYKIGFLGRLSTEKDPFMLAKAASIANKSIPVTVEFAGLGALKKSLEADFPQYSYKGWVAANEWLPTIDLLVNSSKTEGWPLSVIEALEVGVPVIAFNVGGNGEVLEDVSNFAIVFERTEDALAQKIADFLKNYELNCKNYFELLMRRKQATLQDWSLSIIQIKQSSGQVHSVTTNT